MRATSLRSRLLLRTTLSLTAVFVVAAVALYMLMRASLVAEFDQSLRAHAQALISVTEQEDGHVSVELEEETLPPTPIAEELYSFQAWDRDGTTVAKSSSLGERELPRPATSGAEPSFASLTLPDGRRGRAVFLDFEPRVEGKPPGAGPTLVTLAVALDTRRLDGALATLRWLLLAVGAGAVLSGVAVMAWLVRQGLRPLGDLAGSIERVGALDLSERIDPGGAPAELMPVVQRLNELLERLSDAVSREKAFTADVAHELRTPLAGLETVLEVCASKPRDGPAYQDVVGKCLRVTQRMHALVDNLLMLARADARQLAVQADRVDLRDLIAECWEPRRAEADRRRLRVTFDADPADAVAFLDRDKLRMILGNLFDNAVTYADAGGTVTITAQMSGGVVTIDISNSGNQVNSEDAARVFDRFWRGDGARADVGVRCGLGLSLCRKLVEVLGGTIAARSEGGIFAVRLSIPARPAETFTGDGGGAPNADVMDEPARA
ncbi:MAG: ATP-binding protein [Tepidisphaeraceae bacterium]